MSSNQALNGIGVLVTRPVEQAANLVAQLKKLGASPILFPALEILPAANPSALHATLSRIDQFDFHLFVSPTAARYGLAAALSSAAPGQIERLHAAAVGQGTAAVLHAAGCQNVLAPETGADSEHLLALPEFTDLTGKRVLIFRGEGGRELIADTLRARGAEVEYASCYRRACPHVDASPLLHALAQHQVQAITLFSAETLDNLLHLLGHAGAEAARVVPVFAPHERIARQALAQKFSQVITTKAGEDGLLSGLVEYFGHD